MPPRLSLIERYAAHLPVSSSTPRLSLGEGDTPLVRAPSLEAESFIHCTDGAAAMIATANRHYREDPRPFVVLTIDLDQVAQMKG